MSTLGQLKALAIKDLQVSKRSKKRLCCELLVPLFVLPMIIMAAKLSDKYVQAIVPVSPETCVLEVNITTEFYIENLNPSDYAEFSNAAKSLNVKLVDSSPDRIFFNKFDRASKKFEYYIGIGGHTAVGHDESNKISDGWISDDPYQSQGLSDYFNMTLSNRQAQEEHMKLQYTIDQVLLKLASGNNGNEKVTVKFFPENPYGFSFLTISLPFLFVAFVFSSLIPMAMIIKDVIYEGETEIKTYLLVMGMSRHSFYASHFLFGLVKMSIIMAIITVPFFWAFKLKVNILLVIFVFLYVLFCVAFALLCGTILQRVGLAVTLNVLVTLGLTALAFQAANRLNVVEMCLHSLNPLAAFRLGLTDLELMQRYETSPSPLSRFTYQYNLIHAFIFLLLDTFIIISLTFLLELIVPTAGNPGMDFSQLLGIFQRKDKVSGMKEGQSDVRLDKNDFESTEGRMDKPDVDVQNLRKRWGYSGDYAVNGATFQAFPGDITALLGHNGAGKSTTFSCLTGYTKPTSGKVMVCGYDVESSLSAARKYIGYCPQGNPLYERLSCVEHLRLAARLRNAYVGDDDCMSILEKVGLEESPNVMASDLSGGMKRKLCVGMALVGNSRVVLLDEPTAGMDPTARRQIGDILEKFKQDRTIILTTHYMDEADLLSDRILIMVKGKVICAGSSAFLKNRFGTGFLLTVTLRQGVDPVQNSAEILYLIQDYVADAKFDGSPAAQFTVNLPFEGKKQFVRLFSALERSKDALGIDSFGLSVNTLEQVFINVGERAENKDGREVTDKIAENARRVEQQDLSRNPNFVKQVIALVWRNILYQFRSPVRTIVPFLVCLASFAYLWFGLKNKRESHMELKEEEELQLIGTLPYSKIVTNSKARLESLLNNWPQCPVSEIDYNEKKFLDLQFDVPPASFGFFKPDAGSVFLFVSPFLDAGKLIALNIWSNMAFGNGELSNIKTGIIQKKLITGSMMDLFKNLLSGLAGVFGLTYGITMLLNTVITERVKRFKHQIHLASAKWPTYWIAQFISDLAYFSVLVLFVYIATVATIGLNFACSLGILPIYFLYFASSSLASYVISFAFESPTKGSVFILAFHTIIPPLVAMAYFAGVALVKNILQQEPTALATIGIYGLRILFPAISLIFGQVSCISNCNTKKEVFAMYTEKSKEGDLNESWKAVITLSLGSLFYLFWLAFIEMKIWNRISHPWHVRRFRNQISSATDEDYDVTVERQRVAGLSDDQQALATRSLFKFFPPKKCAVQNLTFGMAPNECFGLLGVNGAGKTTTFDMLTNKILPTSGTAKILGIPIQNTPAIGYCPQFDALSDNLTGRETLQLLGRLNGFQNVDERVKLVLECVLLEKKANSLVKTYSGGQKRRLSIAACLMSGSKFLILDEPTAGVDPATRRHIWDLLIAMRTQNKAILLTTHSMEECEALCTRIGFLRAGRLRGIGTSQHLKSRYGNSFILTLILNFPSRENAAFIDDAVRRRFDVSSTDSSPEHSALSWTLPKKEGSIWSEMYAVVEDFVDRVNRESGVEVIHDFYLIQDSLEQVFTRLANSEEDLPDESQEEPLQNAPRNSTLLRNERRTTLDSLKF